MNRRALLVSAGSALLAGCNELVPVPTPTPTREASPTASPSATPSPTAAPAPTETATATESPTPTATEEPTPTGTPTAFDRAVEDARRALDRLVRAYLDQASGADSILDVTARVDFAFRDLNAAAGDAGDAIVSARELADGDAELAAVRSLSAVRAFILNAARGQEAVGDGYVLLGGVRSLLDEERLVATEDRLGVLSQEADIVERAVRTIRRDSSAADLAGYGRVSEEEYTGKIDQLEGGMVDMRDVIPVVETIIRGLERLRQARNLSGNDAEDRAASAIIRFDRALDSLDGLIAGGATEPFADRFVELRSLVDGKLAEAETIAEE